MAIHMVSRARPLSSAGAAALRDRSQLFQILLSTRRGLRFIAGGVDERHGSFRRSVFQNREQITVLLELGDRYRFWNSVHFSGSWLNHLRSSALRDTLEPQIDGERTLLDAPGPQTLDEDSPGRPAARASRRRRFSWITKRPPYEKKQATPLERSRLLH